VKNGSRAKKADFTTGEILGRNDHIITLKRPKDKLEWMSEEEAENRPKELKILEIKRDDKILITTFLC